MPFKAAGLSQGRSKVLGRDYADFREFPIRNCMKRGCWVVVSYSSTHEKTLPDGPLRPGMEVHRASHADSQGAWAAEDSQPSRGPKRNLLRPKKRLPVARLLPHDFPRWPTVYYYYYFRQWRIEKAPGKGSTKLYPRTSAGGRLNRNPQPSSAQASSWTEPVGQDHWSGRRRARLRRRGKRRSRAASLLRRECS